MIPVFIIGSVGAVGMLIGLSLLLRKPVGNTLPARGPAIGFLAVSFVLVGVALWGGKNPRELGRILQPGDLGGCPKVLGPEDLNELGSERATAFSGRKVEGGWCEYSFEFRSGRKLKGKVELDLSARQDEWLKTCGNHPLTQDRGEAWVKRLEDGMDLLCFLTPRYQGAIWLDKDADGLKWQRALQQRLPEMIAAN